MEFFVNPTKERRHQNVLEPDEIIAEVVAPSAARRLALDFSKRRSARHGTPQSSALPIWSRGGLLCRDASIALGGVATTPIRAFAAEQELIGNVLSAAVVARAAVAVIEGARALSQNAYKLPLLKGCFECLRGDAANFKVMRPGALTRRRRFIEVDPISHESFNDLSEAVAVCRFADVAVRAHAVAIDQVLFIIGPGEDDDRNKLRSIVGAHPSEKLKAVHVREIKVNQNNRGHFDGVTVLVSPGGKQIVQRVKPILRLEDGILHAALS